MIRRSIFELTEQLRDVEDRLAIARARRHPYPAVVHALADQAAALQEELWAARRARLKGAQALAAEAAR